MIPARIRLHASALPEIEAAFDWYDSVSPVAAERFLLELDRVFQRIAQSPAQFPTFDFGTRRALLNKFPFAVIFREKDNHIQVIAVAHTKRRPFYWRKR